MMQVLQEGPRIANATVIICAYTLDRWGDLKAAVESVQAQRPTPREVLLVVDYNDELLDRAATLDGLKVLPNTRRRGLSGARNTGISSARGDIIAFLDDDAVAEPGWLAGLCAPLLEREADVVGGRADADFDDGRPRWFPAEFDWVVGCTYAGHPQGRREMRNPIGCSMAFRAEALELAGYFPEGIGRIGKKPLGCEETELCIRLTQRRPGSRIMFEPSAVVRHRVSAERATLRYYVSRCYAEGLSKAAISRLVGGADALSSERRYTLGTLPAGVAACVTEACRHRRIVPLGRAGAIMLGLSATAFGYFHGRLAPKPPSKRS